LLHHLLAIRSWFGKEQVSFQWIFGHRSNLDRTVVTDKCVVANLTKPLDPWMLREGTPILLTRRVEPSIALGFIGVVGDA